MNFSETLIGISYLPLNKRDLFSESEEGEPSSTSFIATQILGLVPGQNLNPSPLKKRKLSFDYSHLPIPDMENSSSSSAAAVEPVKSIAESPKKQRIDSSRESKITVRFREQEYTLSYFRGGYYHSVYTEDGLDFVVKRPYVDPSQIEKIKREFSKFKRINVEEKAIIAIEKKYVETSIADCRCLDHIETIKAVFARIQLFFPETYHRPDSQLKAEASMIVEKIPHAIDVSRWSGNIRFKDLDQESQNILITIKRLFELKIQSKEQYLDDIFPRNFAYKTKPFKLYIVDFEMPTEDGCLYGLAKLVTRWSNGNREIKAFLTENFSAEAKTVVDRQ